MNRQKRYIKFYKIDYKHNHLQLGSYGLMCTRSWWKCFKLGIKHIKQGSCYFFIIQKNRPKKS